MEDLITILTVLVIVMSALIIYKQKIIINDLGKQLIMNQELYKDLFDLYNKIVEEWKYK